MDDIARCLFADSLEHPERVTPQAHAFHAERLAWLEAAYDLPRHPRMPGGG